MTLAFFRDMWYHSIAFAGVLELVDEADSKSTTPFHAAVPESLDLSRVFDNLIWIRFLMSLHDVPPISRTGHRERDVENKDAGVLELVDEADSKSVASDGVWVRVPPPAPAFNRPGSA